MKKLLLIPFLALSCFAATNEADLAKGIDLTGQTNVTLSQLNQLVDNAHPTNNRGMTIALPYIPDYTNNARITNYLWIDTSFAPPKIKVWTIASNRWDEPYLTNFALGSGVVTSDNIANGTIVSADIADGTIAANDLSTGLITSNYLAGDAVRTGNIADDQVTAAKVADGAIDHSDKIAAGIIVRTDIAADAIGGNIVSNYGIESAKIATNAVHGYNLTNGLITYEKMAANSVSNNAIIANTIRTNELALDIVTNLISGWAVYEGTPNSIVKQNGLFSNTVVVHAEGVYSFGFLSPRSDTNYFVSLTTSQIDTNNAETDLVATVMSNLAGHITVRVRDNDLDGAVTPKRLYIQIIGN